MPRASLARTEARAAKLAATMGLRVTVHPDGRVTFAPVDAGGMCKKYGPPMA